MKKFFTCLMSILLFGMPDVSGQNAGPSTGPGNELQTQSIDFEVKDKYFTLNRYGNTSAYLRENNDLSLGALAFEKSQKCYWQFEATGNAGCYYVKNATSGLYIQSTKRGLSQAVPMGDTPVEFKIAKDQTAGAATKGYYYLCSTDQSISNATDGTLGLNYSNGSVVAYHIKSGRGNSYWEIKETEYDYEVPFFAAVADTTDGSHALKYTLLTESHRALSFLADGQPVLKEPSPEREQAWFFAGTSNAKEGYLIASAAHPGQTLNRDEEGHCTVSRSETPTRWFVRGTEKNGCTYLSFIPHAQKEQTEGYLTVEGDSLFRLDNYRSGFNLAKQIYFLPCGTSGNMYLTGLSVTGKDVLKELHYTSSTRPASYYTLYTMEKATVSIGCPFNLEMQLEGAATDGEVFVYADWNADGMFETATQYDARQQQDAVIEVPQTARPGKTRLRIRLTQNGLSGAEDDVWGSTYDFILNVTEPEPDRQVKVSCNASERGTAGIHDVEKDTDHLTAPYGTSVTVEATPLGNAKFVCWRQGRTVVSTQSVYTFTLTENKELQACFSPNTLQGTVAVGSVRKPSETDFTYTVEANRLTVSSSSAIRSVTLYTPNGATVRRSRHKQLSVGSLPQGTYILTVQTAEGESGKKIVLP